MLSPSASLLAQQPERAPALPASQRLVTLDVRDVPLKAVLDEIDRQAKLGLTYSPRIVPVDKRVSIRVTRVPAADALARVLEGTGIQAELTSAGLVALVRFEPEPVVPASRMPFGVVFGVVRDSVSGLRVANVLVRVKGAELGASSNDRGEYYLRSVPTGEQVITTRVLGYLPQEKEVTVEEGQEKRVDFVLQRGAARLQEVVTTATGKQRRLELANSITVIDADSVVGTQPIGSMTELLETRVPGLVTLRTTGAPGDPSRIRLRGSSSILRSNDPIVIVDGVRIYAEQSNTRSASLANSQVPAPSSLDQIDPNSVASVEVLNGPSAATLYGADAANGVIIITTKRGQPGRTSWDVSLAEGRSFMPGRFPESYFAFGEWVGSSDNICSPVGSGPGAGICVLDSLVSYQVLNDPELTVLGRGRQTAVSATVRGGQSNITYAITGSYSDEVGLLKLPRYEANRFRETFSRAPEDWMQRPHRFTEAMVTGRLDLKLAPSADLGVTMNLAEIEQGRSTLEEQLGVLRGAYVDKGTGLVYLRGLGQEPSPTLVPDFYQRTINRRLGVKTGVNLIWLPFERLSIRGDVGLHADIRHDESLLPHGVSTIEPDGFLSTGQGTARMGTLSVGAGYNMPLAWGFRLSPSVGFNYTSQAVADLSRRAQDLSGFAGQLLESTQANDNLTSYGWFVEPRIGNERLFLSTGLRIDGGSNYGSKVSGFALPKIGASWLISDEPLFPFKNSRLLNMLRIRAAYGRAGVQPGSIDRLRLRRHTGFGTEGSELRNLGNTQLRPERSNELEGGFDAELFDNRVSVGLSAYRKTKVDALLNVPVAPSVGAELTSIIVNIGVVRNTGFELTLGSYLLQTNFATLTTNLHLSQGRNTVVSLASGLEAFGIGGNTSQRIVQGFPLNGYWERPLLGYFDANGNGFLERSEILLGDSLAYLGAPEPDYTAALHTNMGLFRGAFTVSAVLNYRGGFAQLNQAPGGPLARARNDPSAPLGHQALVVAQQAGTNYGLFQTVSTLQFHSLSVRWQLPRAVTRWIGAAHGALAVQGTNLGLATNYRGKDPLVNSLATGNATLDAGAIPQPRVWMAKLNLSY